MILFVSPTTLQKGLTVILVRLVAMRMRSGADKTPTYPMRSSTSELHSGSLRCGTLKSVAMDSSHGATPPRQTVSRWQSRPWLPVAP